MTMLYEAATIEDVYLAYEQLKIDDQSLYCCIGVAGAQAGDDVSGESKLPLTRPFLLSFDVYAVSLLGKRKYSIFTKKKFVVWISKSLSLRP